MSLPVTSVIATRNRRAELFSAVDHLTRLAECPAIVVVDNGSEDGSPEAAARLVGVEVIALPVNRGAYARTIGTTRATTELVAFTDDDSWWEPGALCAAASILADDPGLAVVAAQVRIEPDDRPDPICAQLARSPLGRSGDGHRRVLGFLACGAVVRRSAFLDVGGFVDGLGIGGEEELLCMDLAAHGWGVVYAPEVVVHHRPSAVREPAARRRILVRNHLWIAWARRSPTRAMGRTVATVRSQWRRAGTYAGLWDALSGWAWVREHRLPLPPAVERQLRVLERRASGA